MKHKPIVVVVTAVVGVGKVGEGRVIPRMRKSGEEAKGNAANKVVFSTSAIYRLIPLG
jgi:hypothetical protein